MKKKLFILLTIIIGFFSCDNRKARQEAYTVIEDKTITLSYSAGDGLYYRREAGILLLGANPKLEVYCYVTNTSDYGGLFKFNATLSSQGQTLYFKAEEYIGSGNRVMLSQKKEINPFSFETNVNVDDWNIIPPNKTIQVSVTKYRTVYD